MTLVSNGQLPIIRTERGLTIAGTRITLYKLMDYIHAGYPPKLIRNNFYITAEGATIIARMPAWRAS